jgi:hypothetical protein
MTIAVSTFLLALGIAGWESVGGQLLVSGLALLSVCQDLGLRARVGAAFSFLIATAFGISALITAIHSNIRYAPAICVVVLCCEILLTIVWIVRRWLRRTSA